ncbi:hypothetical protein [Methylorubrum extorquens]|uniref:Uncharacterized protein n=1 Tax=Methylorubrum extorquens (strain CM4 / NCIMB 13688) TaxID=440085 RepID=B7KSY0_METC4|nr:hypothetical protein [Methylorubrum extorquens]ACK82482.1 hypothetical protein Mchl_1618 [Methylorubrum extorquens CM4]
MMAAPQHNGPAIEEEILELWSDGFETAEIAAGMQDDAPGLTEAEVANLIAREMDRRYAARQQGGASA